MSPRIFCLILAGFILPPVTTFAQTMETVDSRHVFRDANLVVVLQTKRLEEYLDDEAKEGLTRSHQWLKEVTHLPTATCREIIFQMGSSSYPEEPGYRALNKTIGIAFRCDEAIPSLVIDAFRGRFELDEYDHKERVYLMRDAREPTFYFGGESLLLCETGQTQALIDSELESNDPEIPILEDITRDIDIAVQIDFENESFQRFFPLIFDGLEPLDGEECLKTIANHASRASLTIRLDEMRPLTIQVEVADDGDIEELKTAVEQFAEASQKFAAMLQQELTRGAPSKGVTDNATAFADSFAAFLARPEITADQTTVTLQIDDIENGEATLNNFVKMMNALAEHFGA